jgi:hypothetical protein
VSTTMRTCRRVATSEWHLRELARQIKAERRRRAGHALIGTGIVLGLLGAGCDVFGLTVAAVVFWGLGYPALLAGFRSLERADDMIRRGSW